MESCRPTGNVATKRATFVEGQDNSSLKAMMCQSLVVSQLVVMGKQRNSRCRVG